MPFPTAPAVPPKASPFEAAQQAIDYARRQLFPFRFDRWLALGFVAFLDQCGRGGGGGGGGYPPNLGIKDTDGFPSLPGLPGLPPALTENLTLIVVVAAVGLSFALALIALVLWINSRGIFMYVDNVSSGRSDVARPWSEHKELASSLFAWRFGLALATLAGVLFLGGMAALAYFAVRRGQLGSGIAIGIALLALLPMLLVLILAASLFSVALRDFVAPIQMAEKISCGDAFAKFLEILRANIGTFVVYVLLKIVFAIGFSIVAMLAGCLTCCLGFIPIVAQTLLQPALYFERAWSLFLLRSLGVDLLGETALASTSPPSSSSPSSSWGPPPLPPSEEPSAL